MIFFDARPRGFVDFIQGEAHLRAYPIERLAASTERIEGAAQLRIGMETWREASGCALQAVLHGGEQKPTPVPQESMESPARKTPLPRAQAHWSCAPLYTRTAGESPNSLAAAFVSVPTSAPVGRISAVGLRANQAARERVHTIARCFGQACRSSQRWWDRSRNCPLAMR